MNARLANDVSLPRRIFFYRAYIGQNQAGRPLALNPQRALTEINQLPWNQNYWETQDGKVTCCWVDRAEPIQRLRLGITRRVDLPQIEENGQLMPLDLPDHSGLAEQIHVCFFRNNIVGADFNFYGPRLQRLAHYLNARSPNNFQTPIVFEQLLKQDAMEQLRRLNQIRMLTMRIRPAYIQAISQASLDLGNTFAAAQRAGGGDVGILEVTLKPAPYQQGWLNPSLLTGLRRLAGRQDIRDNVDKLLVKGYDREEERISTIDLLNDRLISEKRIVRVDGRGRALNSISAYSAIEEAYQDLREQIEAAAAVA